MINDRVVDMHNSLARSMVDNGIVISPQVSQNLSSILQAFGGIGFDARTVIKEEKIEEKKANIKKDAGPKMVEVTEKLISYKEFETAIDNIRIFDL